MLKHYKFQQRLIYKANCCSNVKVFLVDESYISKTCTNCGNLHQNLSSNDNFDCTTCKISIDRDVNGARNILIKNTQLVY